MRYAGQFAERERIVDNVVKVRDFFVIPIVCRRHPMLKNKNLLAQVNLDSRFSFFSGK
jgi:hypothetical protein